MGRPLYSHVFYSTPAVRDPEPPTCEKWSYLNSFDPDADEFFDNENAVYEDFIDPVMPVNPGEEVFDVDEEEDEMDMLVVRMGNASPITSESSLSDNESPLSVGTDAFLGINQTDEGESEPEVRVRLATRALPGEARWGSQTTESERPRDPRRRYQLATRSAFRGSPYRSYTQRDELPPLPAPSAPIPVPSVSRRSAMFDERALLSPSTPPRQTPVTHISMSPPPTSTPRLYTWARNPSHPTSPSSGSPFTNPHARTSYTHLSPALIRIRDVTV